MPINLQPAFSVNIGGTGTSEAYQFNSEGMVEIVPTSEGYDGMLRVTVNALNNKWLKPNGKVPEANVVNDTTFNVKEYATMDAPHQVFTDKDIIERQNRFSILKRVEVPAGTTRMTSLFRSHNNLQEVILPPSCTDIMSQSFSSCMKLEKINLDNVINIGDNAFYYCELLKDINLSNNLNTLGQSAFESCKSLERIVIPDTITEIPRYAFRYCSSLSEIYFPNTLTKLNTYCLHKTNIKYINYNEPGEFNLVFPNSLTTLASDVFSNTSVIKAIIPETITSCDSYTFQFCKKLKHAEYLANTTTLPGYTFDGCIELEEVIIGNHVKTISDYAFQDCNKLSNVTFPNSVTQLYNNIFNIKTGTKPELTLTFLSITPPSIMSTTFNNCNLVKVKVPAESVNAYKTASRWSAYADIIEAI